MRLIFLFIFIWTCGSAFGSPSHVKLDPCVGNFCLFRPIKDQQFTKRYGSGSVRFDEEDKLTSYRCFYIAGSKLWVEFQFDNHERGSSRLVSVFITRSELCSTTYVAPTALSTDLNVRTVSVGLNEPDLVKKLGRPARIEILSGDAKNSIFYERFGDHANVYETEDSVLYAVVYFRRAEAIGYRLSVEE